jgi:hypothetical protein
VASVTWVRIDDHFDEHPKLAQAGTVCWGIWLAGIAYCNRNLTDGFIPWAVAKSLGSWEMLDLEDDEEDPQHRRRIWTVGRSCGMSGEDMETEWVIERMVGVGLWDQIPGGFRIHDYDDYQPTKQEILAERAKTKERVADWRKRRKPSGNADSNGATNGVVTGAPYPVPVPNPVPEILSNVHIARATDWLEPATFYEERTKRKPSQKVRDWLEDLHARFSRTELIAAMQAVPNPREPDWLKKVDAYLERVA